MGRDCSDERESRGEKKYCSLTRDKREELLYCTG
jgi:hypothetical protein